MAEPTLVKRGIACHVDDGEKRGPLTLVRLALLPDSRWLLGQCVDRRLALWDLASQPQALKRPKGEFLVGSLVCPHEAGWIRGLAVQPRGEFLATGGSDRKLRLWKWEGERPSESPLAEVAAHDGWVEAVAWSPDGQLLATAGADRQVKLWNAADLTPLRSQLAHDNFPRDLAFSPEGALLVSGGEDGRLIVLSASTLEVQRAIDFGHNNDQQGQTPSFSGVSRLAIGSDGRWLAAAGDERLAVFELATGLAISGQREGSMDVAAHDGLLAAGQDTVRVWRYDAEKFSPQAAETKTSKEGRREPPKLPPLPAEELAQIKRGDFSLGLAFSADGKLLAAGKTDGTVELWDIA